MRIPLYRSLDHDCSYLPGRVARTLFVDPDLEKSNAIHASLQRSGFRRSGSDLYRPDCPHCSACIPARLPVARFSPRRRHRRLMRDNQGMFRLSWVPAELSDEVFALYHGYLNNRHGDGEMANPEPEDFSRFLLSGWSETRFLQLHHKDRLVAVAVTDFTPNAASAVYTFFDPSEEYKRNALGVFCLLSQIEQMNTLERDWLYLGFWVAGCRKMEYKANYRPIQLLMGDRWVEVQPGGDLPQAENAPGPAPHPESKPREQ